MSSLRGGEGGKQKEVGVKNNAEKLLDCGATIRIGQEIRCLPYAGYFFMILSTDLPRRRLSAKKLAR